MNKLEPVANGAVNFGAEVFNSSEFFNSSQRGMSAFLDLFVAYAVFLC